MRTMKAIRRSVEIGVKFHVYETDMYLVQSGKIFLEYIPSESATYAMCSSLVTLPKVDFSLGPSKSP